MKRIFYSSGSIVTGDRTADSVLNYAKALAEREASDMIDIPILGPDGVLGRAQLLIGPSSELMSVTEPPHASEPDDEVTLDSLAMRIEALLRPKSLPIDQLDLAAAASEQMMDLDSSYSEAENTA